MWFKTLHKKITASHKNARRKKIIFNEHNSSIQDKRLNYEQQLHLGLFTFDEQLLKVMNRNVIKNLWQNRELFVPKLDLE